MIPVYNYINTGKGDFSTCPFVDDMVTYNYNNNADKIFADVASYILPIVKKPLGKASNLTNTEID